MKQETQNQINTLAATLADQIDVTSAGSTIAADAYVKSLPEGITLETVQKINEHNSVFFPAVTKSFGEKALNVMKEDNALESCSLTVPMVGDDKFDVSVQKQYQYLNTKTKEMETAFGGVSASYTVQSARQNRGAMQSIRNDLKAQALALFGKD